MIVLNGRFKPTDNDGRFLLRDVGIHVAFVVDVIAPNKVPTSSKPTKLEPDETTMNDTVLETPAVTVVGGGKSL